MVMSAAFAVAEGAVDVWSVVYQEPLPLGAGEDMGL